jgi:hypothetical protein
MPPKKSERRLAAERLAARQAAAEERGGPGRRPSSLSRPVTMRLSPAAIDGLRALATRNKTTMTSVLNALLAPALSNKESEINTMYESLISLISRIDGN